MFHHIKNELLCTFVITDIQTTNHFCTPGIP